MIEDDPAASPLSGWRVLVPGTRPERLSALLEERGARPLAIPTIEIRTVADPAADRALLEIDGFDWVVVTSENGVRATVDRLATLERRLPVESRWAAVGPRTAAALRERGIAPEAVPGRGLAAALPDAMGPVGGLRVLLARARQAGRALPEILGERGADVVEAAVYETVEGPERSRALLAAAVAEGLEAAIFTSGSTARGVRRLLAGREALGGCVTVAIGPSTARAAEFAGVRVDRVARRPTPGALVDALERVALDRRARSGELEEGR